MSFVRVDRPQWAPHRCVMTLRDTDPDGFYVGQAMQGYDPHAYVSFSAARTMARDQGFVSGEEHQATVDELTEAQARVEALEVEVAEREAFIGAIDVIESKDFRTRKKAGRPKTERTAA